MGESGTTPNWYLSRPVLVSKDVTYAQYPQNDVSQCCSRETRSIPWRITIPLTVEALSQIQLGSRLCGNTPFYMNIRTRWANVTKNVCRNRRCMSNVAEMVNVNVPGSGWGGRD